MRLVCKTNSEIQNYYNSFMSQVRWLLDIPFEVSAHLTKDKWRLNLATLLLLPKCWLNRPIFHLCKCIYTKSTHTQNSNLKPSIALKQQEDYFFHFQIFCPISKFQKPVPEEIGCRMPWNADHLTMAKAKAKYHIPTGMVRSQTQTLPLISSRYRKQREQKL